MGFGEISSGLLILLGEMVRFGEVLDGETLVVRFPGGVSWDVSGAVSVMGLGGWVGVSSRTASWDGGGGDRARNFMVELMTVSKASR
jgi:hypothetical protein